jgi:drug/metabolite transporter (DMT)-like permease
LLKSLFKKWVIPVTWTLIIQVLLCLPGSAFPKSDLFDIPHLDKIVHIILFGGFVGSWCYYLFLKNISASRLKSLFFIVFLIAMANGIILEFIQRDYIPNRSFEEGDIIADIIAAGIAYGICNLKLLKTSG